MKKLFISAITILLLSANCFALTRTEKKCFYSITGTMLGYYMIEEAFDRTAINGGFSEHGKLFLGLSTFMFGYYHFITMDISNEYINTKINYKF